MHQNRHIIKNKVVDLLLTSFNVSMKAHIFSLHPFNHLQFFNILYIYTMFSSALHKLTTNIHYFVDIWDFFLFFL